MTKNGVTSDFRPSKAAMTLGKSASCNSLKLEKNLGRTRIAGQEILDEPLWHWPDKNR
jgi:hypothetical protein